MKLTIHAKPFLAALTTLVLATTAASVSAEMVGLQEEELSMVSGQSGISIQIPKFRMKIDGVDYVTKEHNGGEEAHYFTDEYFLKFDMGGAITLDVEDDGALVIGLPDNINYVEEGYTSRGIYLNTTGNPLDGGKLYNEISIQGNFDTGGTVTIWND